MITQSDLEHWFSEQEPTPDQRPRYKDLRTAGKHLAMLILKHTPTSEDQHDAIRKVREAVWTAVAAIDAETLGLPKPPHAR